MEHDTLALGQAPLTGLSLSPSKIMSYVLSVDMIEMALFAILD